MNPEFGGRGPEADVTERELASRLLDQIIAKTRGSQAEYFTNDYGKRMKCVAYGHEQEDFEEICFLRPAAKRVVLPEEATPFKIQFRRDEIKYRCTVVWEYEVYQVDGGLSVSETLYLLPAPGEDEDESEDETDELVDCEVIHSGPAGKRAIQAVMKVVSESEIL